MFKNKNTNYGLDAPQVIRNLIIAGLGFILLLIIYLKSQQVQKFVASYLGSNAYLVPWLILMIAVSYLIPAFLMILSSKCGKKYQRDKILKNINIKGTDHILDVGCGRGLFLIGAAHYLTSGKAVGVDLWTNDLSGNSKKATIMNAEVEGVLNKIEVKDGNACQLPFPDSSFDIVLSNLVIHNIKTKSDREKALSEIIRVTKPDGKIIIQDFQYTYDYAFFLEEQGLDVEISSLSWQMFPPVRTVYAIKN